MHATKLALTIAAGLTLSACAGLQNAPPDAIASLPVVTFPAKPASEDFVYKLPGGQAIPALVIIDGSALASGAEQTLAVTLPADLYLYKQWASDDGVHWHQANEMIDVALRLSLPSDANPGPGEIHLTVNRKTDN
ncbi:MAG: hypothetical protein KDH88_05880 [Chromatiales bacterium]|nr:hypothetical protein [Chromatiales bacterium]